MISQETIKGIKKTIKDWSKNDMNTIQDLRVLFVRIADGVKGNRSFRDSLEAVIDVTDDLIQDLLP